MARNNRTGIECLCACGLNMLECTVITGSECEFTIT